MPSSDQQKVNSISSMEDFSSQSVVRLLFGFCLFGGLQVICIYIMASGFEFLWDFCTSMCANVCVSTSLVFLVLSFGSLAPLLVLLFHPILNYLLFIYLIVLYYFYIDTV